MSKIKTAKELELEILKINLEWVYENGIDFQNRTIRITGAIAAEDPHGLKYTDFDTIDVAMTRMEKESNKPITLKINSPGGEMYEAQAIVGRMKSSDCDIITEAYGHAMSAATLILMAGDIRRISHYCQPMFHQIGYGAMGQHEDVKEQVAQAEKEQKRWAKYYEDFSDRDAKFWLAKMKKTEFYPTPEQMLEFGAVDEII